MHPLSVWNPSRYRLLSKCMFEIPILTGYSPNVCLELQSFQATLYAAIVCFKSQSLKDPL